MQFMTVSKLALMYTCSLTLNNLVDAGLCTLLTLNNLVLVSTTTLLTLNNLVTIFEPQ